MHGNAKPFMTQTAVPDEFMNANLFRRNPARRKRSRRKRRGACSREKAIAMGAHLPAGRGGPVAWSQAAPLAGSLAGGLFHGRALAA